MLNWQEKELKPFCSNNAEGLKYVVLMNKLFLLSRPRNMYFKWNSVSRVTSDIPSDKLALKRLKKKKKKPNSWLFFSFPQKKKKSQTVAVFFIRNTSPVIFNRLEVTLTVKSDTPWWMSRIIVLDVAQHKAIVKKKKIYKSTTYLSHNILVSVCFGWLIFFTKQCLLLCVSHQSNVFTLSFMKYFLFISKVKVTVSCYSH